MLTVTPLTLSTFGVQTVHTYLLYLQNIYLALQLIFHSDQSEFNQRHLDISLSKMFGLEKCTDPARIRTWNLLLRRQTRYPLRQEANYIDDTV